MTSFNRLVDQLGREVPLDRPPQRIVSLVPSQTELLHYLGFGDRVVGITKFCVHPESWFRGKTRIGGTKDFKFDRIQALNPDLIIANKEENTKDGIDELAAHYPVYISDVKNLADALSMIKDVATWAPDPDIGTNLIQRIKTQFESFRKEKQSKRLRVAYLIWWNPMMSIGGDTFINQMLNECGFDNVFSEKDRYPVVSFNELSEANPDLILLSSEPFPFRDKHIQTLDAEIPGKTIQLVDGELFSWYGNRLLKAVPYFRSLWDQINTK